MKFEKRILTRVDARTNTKFLNQHNGCGDFSLKQHTEETKEKISKSHKERFNPNTPKGRKNKEKRSQSTKAQFDINTESGRRNRKNRSEIKIEFYKTEQGRKRRENLSENKRKFWDKNTEEGRRNREIHSKSQRNLVNINLTEIFNID